MEIYPDEYRQKLHIDQELRRYHKRAARKNGLASLDRVMAYLPDIYKPRAMRRGMAFAHLGMEQIVECIAHGKPFTIVSGLNPSSPLHMGHKALFEMLAEFQNFGADVQIPLTNDESYVDGKVTSIQESMRIAQERIVPEIQLMGLDPQRTKIYLVTESPEIYRFAMSISKLVTYDMVKAVFGKESLVNVGQIFYRGVVQLAQILLPQIDRPVQTLIPVGIDQHPYVLLARDVAKKLGMIPPSELVIKFQPSLLDPMQKMSGSKPNTAIFINDTETEIRKKIFRAYSGSTTLLQDHRQYGGIPEICPVFALLKYHHPDDEYVTRMEGKYRTGQITVRELKESVSNYICYNGRQYENS
jgi:tryptophanyl-tRNA synthetase